MSRLVTKVCLLREPGLVLLARRKTGTWIGCWDTYGGKVERNESVEQSAVREVNEESSVLIVPRDLRHMATLFIYASGALKYEIRVFTTTIWSGTPAETIEEGKPEWFAFDRLPSRMRPGDKLWLPRVLSGEHLTMSLDVGLYGDVHPIPAP